MTTKQSTIANLLKDLEDLYLLAMKKGNFTVALKAKELLGRELGLFSSSPKKSRLSLADLSDEDLTRLIEESETQLKDSPQHHNKKKEK